MARRYYDALHKEYAICDLSRWREGAVGLRWRTAAEVTSGKGERICAARGATRARRPAELRAALRVRRAGRKEARARQVPRLPELREEDQGPQAQPQPQPRPARPRPQPAGPRRPPRPQEKKKKKEKSKAPVIPEADIVHGHSETRYPDHGSREKQPSECASTSGTPRSRPRARAPGPGSRSGANIMV